MTWRRLGWMQLREPTSDCPAMRDYSKAYLHHLIKAGEMLGATLLSSANVHFYQQLMGEMRRAIEEQRFDKFAQDFTARYASSSDADC